MPLAIPDFPIKIMPAFEDKHYFCKMGEGKSHCLITDVLRKININEDRFLPISERPNSFSEIQDYFRFTETALGLCTSKSLLRRFRSKDQNKL